MRITVCESEPALKVPQLPPASSRPSLLIRDPALRLRNSNCPSDSVSTLIPPEKNAFPQLSIFSTLADVARTNTVSLHIPETLIVRSGALSQTLLHTRNDGVVTCYRGVYGLDKFFEAVRIRTQNTDAVGGSQFVFRGEDGMKVCETQEEAVHLLCRGDLTGEMQSCLKCRSELMRVHCSAGRVDAYLLRGEATKDKHSSSLSRITHRSKVEVSMYQHRPADFVYAGKLLRSSFSPYSPFKSKLTPASQSPIPGITRRDNGMSSTTDRLPLRDFSSGERKTIFPLYDSELKGTQVVRLENKYTFLEHMGETILAVVEIGKKLPRGSCSEVVFDCVMATDSHCYLLRCVAIALASPLVPSSPRKTGECLTSPDDSDSSDDRKSPRTYKRSTYVRGTTKADTVEFYEKSFRMKKGGMVPFKIIGVHAKNHETQLLTTFQDRLDPLLRAHRQRKKPQQVKTDVIADFMTKVESSYDSLRVKARQSKYDLADIRKIVQGIVKDTNFGERIFFSFFERTRMIPQLAEVFANKTRDEIKTIRAKFIEILQNVDSLTSPPRYRPTAATVGITSEQYSLFDGILQKVFEIEDLPQLVIPIAKERILILVGEIIEGL